jgi:hypothetical protein
VQLNIAHIEVRIVGYGGPYHIYSVKFVEQRTVLLKRILRRYHKPHLAERCLLGNRIGYNKMAYMNGVERAKKQAYFHIEVMVGKWTLARADAGKAYNYWVFMKA